MDLEKENLGEFSQSTGLSSLDATPSHSRQQQQQQQQQQKRVQINDGPQSDKSALVPAEDTPTEDKPKRPVLDQPIIVLQGREVLFAIGIFFLFAVVVSLMVIYITTLTKMREYKQLEDTCKRDKNSFEEQLKTTRIDLNRTRVDKKKAEERNEQLSKENTETKDALNISLHSLNISELMNEMLEVQNEELTGRLNKTCANPDCLRAAVDLLDKMDLKVDPCGDFWLYSCGTWLSKAEIPKSREAWGLDTETEKTFFQSIRDDLRNLRMDSSRVDSAERKFKTLFGVCSNGSAQMADEGPLGDNPLATILANWTVCQESRGVTRTGCHSKWQDLLESLFFDYGIDALFDLNIIKNADDTNLNYIKIDYGGWGLPGRTHHLSHRQAHNLFGSHYEDYITQTVTAVDSKLRGEAIKRFVASVVDFEKKLAQAENDSRNAGNSGGSTPTIVTIAELQEMSSQIKWLEFMRRISSNFSSQSKVVLVSKNYVANISNLVSIGNRNLEDYLKWRLVSHLAPLLSTSLKNNQQVFINRHKEQMKNPPELKLQRFCQDEVIDRFPYALIASIARQDSDIQAKLADVAEMSLNIRTTLTDTVLRADWMDNETAVEAQTRLENLRIEAGFPKFVLNETEVDRYYDTVEISDKLSFFQNIINTLKQKMDLLRLRLESPNDIYDQVWDTDPLHPNVFFSSEDNIMGVTLSLLQKPFYDVARYSYLNYGSLGSMIAHEMIAAIFDAGNRELSSQWWSRETSSNFRNRSRCLKDYHKRLAQEPNQVAGHLDFGEYVADLGGLFHSYKAYKNWETENGEEAILPGLNLSNEQAFFVGFAQNLCKLRKKNAKKRSAGQSYPPAEEIRVRGTLLMSDIFQEVYKCQEMIPENGTTVAPQCDRLLW